MIDMGMVAGFVAAGLASLTPLPQTIKTLRTRNTEGVSLMMPIFSIGGNTCWFINGVSFDNWALILSAIFVTSLNIPIAYLTYKNACEQRRLKAQGKMVLPEHFRTYP